MLCFFLKNVIFNANSDFNDEAVPIFFFPSNHSDELLNIQTKNTHKALMGVVELKRHTAAFKMIY